VTILTLGEQREKNISLFMARHKSDLFLFASITLILFAARGYGQDTARYWRGKTIFWVSECYTFYKLNQKNCMWAGLKE